MKSYLRAARKGVRALRNVKRELGDTSLQRALFVPDYIYAARTSDDLVPVFEAQYYRGVDEYDPEILFDDDMHEMAKRIGYTYFAELRYRIPDPATWNISELGDEGFTWRYLADRLPEKPIVYAFGAGTNISFETEFAKKHACVVESFDPTPQAVEYVRKLLPDNPNVHFHAMGLLDVDGQVKFYKPRQKNLGSLSALNLNASHVFMEANVMRLRSIMKELGHEQIDLLKLDIEGAEHRALEDMLFSGIEPEQIAVEFDQPVPPWRIERTMAKLFLAGYILIDCWGLNCLFVKATED